MILRLFRDDSNRFQDDLFVGATLDVSEEKSTRFDYDFEAGTSLRGRLLDSNGKGIDDASVVLNTNPEPAGYLGVWALGDRTDRKGNFEIKGVPHGRYELCAHRMKERSQASKMGTVCEGTEMEFKTSQKFSVGDTSPPALVITVTDADRKHAKEFEAAQAAAMQKEMQAATTQAAK